MNSDTFFWLSLTLLCIFTQSFYSMLEMACVSFNRIRLQFYVTQGDQRAIWLNTLLANPSRLFGTTLVGVNVALQVGSECSRQLYSAANLSPDLAPLTQVILVLIFAELAPMFAARRYAEHVAFLGIPIIYASSLLLRPVTWSFHIISQFANRMMGAKQLDQNIFITRDELQKVFEEGEEEASRESPEDFTTVVANIFDLRNKTAGQCMEPLSTVPMLPNQATVGQVREVLRNSPEAQFIPIYHRTRRNIIGIAIPRDLIRLSDSTPVLDHARSPWFLTRTARIFRTLKQFRQNNQGIAVVLSDKGSAIGLLSLEGILSEIFGKSSKLTLPALPQLKRLRLIEKTFSGETRLNDLNTQFALNLPQEGETLLDLMVHRLGHEPEEGEAVRIANWELKVEQASLLGPKTISIRTLT